MNINIEKKNFEQLNINEWKGHCGQALDYLWESPWVRASIGKSDRRNLSALQVIADKITGQSDIALILASGEMADLIKAVSSALPTREGGAEVLVFGSEMSPVAYERVLGRLSDCDFSLIAVTEGEESLSLRAVYTCFKQILVSRYGKETASERIFAVAGSKSLLIAKDASEEDYPLISYPEQISPVYGGNTDAVLLPLAIKGYNPAEYLDGFYETLASPSWDLDGADYAVAKALTIVKGTYSEELLIWQEQLSDFGRWIGGIRDFRKMPEDERTLREEAFETMIFCDCDETDIMMPYFEGCSMEGSLHFLLKETADKYFFRNSDEKPGVKISLKELNPAELGRLTAFMELSKGISEFLVKLVN